MRHSHPFVLGSGKTQKNKGNFRSGLYRNAEKVDGIIFMLGFCETQPSFFLGSGKTQKNTNYFRSGDLGKSRRTWIIFVLGSGKTQKNMGHFRSGLHPPQKK